MHAQRHNGKEDPNSIQKTVPQVCLNQLYGPSVTPIRQGKWESSQSHLTKYGRGLLHRNMGHVKCREKPHKKHQKEIQIHALYSVPVRGRKLGRVGRQMSQYMVTTIKLSVQTQV